MDVRARADDRSPFQESLPETLLEFRAAYPDDAACAAYLETARWADGFRCPHCGSVGEPYRFRARPAVLRCRSCRRDTGVTVGTVMERSHVPLSTWFLAAYLLVASSSSQTRGMSAMQLQRQLGLTRYETAYYMLQKLRAATMAQPPIRTGSADSFRAALGLPLVAAGGDAATRQGLS